ncbi:TRAP transporter substrate-binding protein DctP [Candidatus Omnitrophota bacterium]
MKKKKLYILLGSCCLMLIITMLPFMAACAKSAPAGPVIMRYAAFVPQAHFWTASHDAFLDELEQGANNQFTVERFYAGSLIAATDMLDSVSRGVVDFAQVALGYTPAKFKLVLVADPPFQSSDAWAIHYAINELQFKSPLKEEWEGLNVKSLKGQITQVFLWTKKPVRTLDDIKGVKLRTYGLQAAAVEALGAVPVALTYPEIYESLQRGNIDGVIGSFTDVYAAKWHEFLNHCTDVGFGTYGYAGFLMNTDSYERLPGDYQKVVDKLVEERVDKMVEATKQYYRDTGSALKNAGVSFSVLSPDEFEKWQQIAGEPIWQKWINERPEIAQDRAEMMEDFHKLFRKYEKDLADEPHPFELF